MLKKTTFLIILSLASAQAIASQACQEVYESPSGVKEGVAELRRAIDDNGDNFEPQFFNHTYRGEATLKDLQTAMYETGLLVRDSRFDFLEDKLVIGKALEQYLGTQAKKFYGRSEEITPELLSGNIKSKLKKMFPLGVILKPRSGAGSGGVTVVMGHGAVVKFLKAKSYVELKDYFLQEAPQGISSVKKVQEFRAHSLWGQVIKKATMSRWGAITNPFARPPVERFLQDFMDHLPEGLKVGHAWSFDIIEFSSGKYLIVDINTAGTHGENWSGFLQNPIMLSHLVHSLNTDFAWNFPGVSGFLLKNKLGNGKKVRSKIRMMYQKHGLFLRPAK